MRRLAEIAFERFSTSFLSYYNLWAYLDRDIKRLLSGQKTHSPANCIEFYSRFYAGEIKPGDRVILNGFFISEWVPRCPGGIAHFVGGTGLPDNFNKLGSFFTMNHLREFGLSKAQYFNLAREFNVSPNTLADGDFIPPYGSIRFPLVNGKPKLLGAVTESEYNADFGIPLAVSDSVYAEFLSKQNRNFSVEATLEGYLDVFQPTTTNVFSHSSSNCLSLPFSQPRLVVCIDSPIQVVFRSNNNHPQFNSWIIRRNTYLRRRLKSAIVGKNIDGSNFTRKIYGELVEYEFFNYPIFTNSKEEMMEARRIIENLPLGIMARTFGSQENIDSMRRSISNCEKLDMQYYRDLCSLDRVDNLTEFDGRWDMLNPLVSFRTDPRKSDSAYTFLDEIRKIEANKNTEGA